MPRQSQGIRKSPLPSSPFPLPFSPFPLPFSLFPFPLLSSIFYLLFSIFCLLSSIFLSPSPFSYLFPMSRTTLNPMVGSRVSPWQ